MQFIHEHAWYIFLAWCTGDGVGQRPLLSIFTMTDFWSESKVGLLQLLYALECEVIWGWSFFLFTSSPIILSFSRFFTLGEHTKSSISLFFSTAVYLAWRLHCPQMWLRPNDWTVLLHISHCSLLISSVKSCSHGSCGGEKGLAQSSLATLCITRMQMSYEAIHLLEMPPWFQFESCLQSHCVSPLLHVKEVSLCERSEGDNCT